MIGKVRIHVITFKRVNLLKRALLSIQNQTYTNWIAEVINDDPNDNSVEALINSFNDSRIILSKPVIKRGGTGNFNYAFRRIKEPYACILEDDNWYEPNFIEIAVKNIELHNVEVVVANEIIWKELQNGQWEKKNSIWEATSGVELFLYNLEDKCGQAKICNSSMLWKTKRSYEWITPKDIPIDVTEHFRERVLPHPILLIKIPLVNYAETIATYRNGNSNKWSIYQTLLVASVFEKLNNIQANNLAEKLWSRARCDEPFFRTTLINVSLSCIKARVLFKKANFFEIFKYSLSFLKRPRHMIDCINARKNQKEEWEFLIKN